MKLVVGLGNPGKKYEGTRHNMGFEVLFELTRRHAAPKPKEKFEARICEVLIAGERVLLAAPQTYMNSSGRSVRQIVDFLSLSLDELLVVCDDINLPLGRLRLRGSGSAGGQKGLENIIQQLGTPDFARLRLGVSLPPPEVDAADYVLSRFHKSELPAANSAILAAADAVEAWVSVGLQAAMNRFNSGPEPSSPGESDDSKSGSRPAKRGTPGHGCKNSAEPS
jgi:PTH1 family peptidyl-tRNA hydrolase